MQAKHRAATRTRSMLARRQAPPPRLRTERAAPRRALSSRYRPDFRILLVRARYSAEPSASELTAVGPSWTIHSKRGPYALHNDGWCVDALKVHSHHIAFRSCYSVERHGKGPGSRVWTEDSRLLARTVRLQLDSQRMTLHSAIVLRSVSVACGRHPTPALGRHHASSKKSVEVCDRRLLCQTLSLL